MKKELLMATALVSTLGAASVAQAVTATMSGSWKAGVEFDGPETGVDTQNVVDLSNFSVSLSETTDAGTTISSSFGVIDEGASDIGDDDNSIKLTFTDGSAVELLNAGNALGTHDIAVPSGAGEMGVAGTTTNQAPTDLDFMAGSTALGVEWHSAADFLADGLKMSASYSTDNGAAKVGTARLENSWGVGATYVTSAGDTALTVGAGFAGGDVVNTGSNQAAGGKEGFTVGVSAVTGDLTVAVGYADGDSFDPIDTAGGNTANMDINGSVTKVGISYVTGDITLAVGATSGEATDVDFGTAPTTDDAKDTLSGSVTYAVASGVSAVLGYVTEDHQNDGASDTTGGSSWYVGATMSF
jgi:predicted porin